MYIIIEKEPYRLITFETKSDLANYLGVHSNTITNRFKDNVYWEYNNKEVHQAFKHYKRFRSGNRDSGSVKLGKRNGEIPLKRPKKK